MENQKPLLLERLFCCLDNTVIANQPAGWCGNPLWLRTAVPITDCPGNLKGIPTPVCALARNDMFYLRLLAAVLTLLVLGLILLSSLAGLVLLAVLVLSLVLIAVIHRSSSKIVMAHGLGILCAVFQALSLGLKIRLTTSPAMMAAVMPQAVAFSPPPKIPRKPSSVTAFFTPLAKV